MKHTHKIRIVDGKIINPGTAVNPPASTDTFLDELKEFSLDLTVQKEIKESENTTKPVSVLVPKAHSLPEGIEEASLSDFRLIEGILIPKNQPYLPEEYRPELLARQGKQRVCPYLNENDISDYGGFMNYLMNSGRSKRTRYDYTIDLRKWKKELGKLNGQLTVDNINSVLSHFKPARGSRLLAALKSYANYRNFHQDGKLLILLTTSLTLNKPGRAPKQERNKSTDAVTPEEAKHYRNLAKDLCDEGRKEGIWIGLSLMGVPPGNLAKISFPDQSHVEFIFRRKKKNTKIEKWLYNACKSISGWRVGRRNVHHGISKYEITPMALNQHATRK